MNYGMNFLRNSCCVLYLVNRMLQDRADNPERIGFLVQATRLQNNLVEMHARMHARELVATIYH
jgi:hypothetical protein